MHEQFSVTIGTIFEDSQIPLNERLFAFHLLCSSKKGMRAHQIHRILGVTVKTNAVEGYLSILKRGINGAHHHNIGECHLHRYLSEHDFRYNFREAADAERCELGLKGTDGKRLMLRESHASKTRKEA